MSVSSAAGPNSGGVMPLSLITRRSLSEATLIEELEAAGVHIPGISPSPRSARRLRLVKDRTAAPGQPAGGGGG